MKLIKSGIYEDFKKTCKKVAGNDVKIVDFPGRKCFQVTGSEDDCQKLIQYFGSGTSFRVRDPYDEDFSKDRFLISYSEVQDSIKSDKQHGHTDEEYDFVVQKMMDEWLEEHEDATNEQIREHRKRLDKYVRETQARSIKSASTMPRYNGEGKIWSDSLDEYVWEKVRYKDGDTYHWDDVNLLYWNDNGDEGDYLMITTDEGLPRNCTPIKNSRKAIKSDKQYIVKISSRSLDGSGVGWDRVRYYKGGRFDSKEPQYLSLERAEEIADDLRHDEQLSTGFGNEYHKVEIEEVTSSRKAIKSSSESSIMIYIRNPETGKWASQAWCNKYQKDPYYYDRAEIIDNPAGYPDEERVIYWGDDINDAMCFSTPERARAYPLKGELYTAEDVPLLGVKLDTIQPLNNSYKPIKSSTGNLPKEVYYMVVQGAKMYYSTDYDKVKDMVLKMNSKSGPRVYGPYVEDDPEEIQELYEVGYLSNSRQIKSSVSINSLKEDLEGNFWTRKEDFEKDVASAGWDVEEMNSEYAVISNDYGSEYEIRFNSNGDGVSLTVKDVIPLLLEDDDDDLIDSSRESDSFDNGYDRNVRNINNILSR